MYACVQGLGEFQKSTSVPKEVSKLEGVKVLQLAMGYSHTMIIAATDTQEQRDKLDTLPVFEP